MIRKIVHIDEEKCNGCGLCAKACHEDAIQMIDGKARLVKDDYCDGLGDCLPACPADAIQIVEREAAAYDHAAVQARIAAKKTAAPEGAPAFHGCPGSMARQLRREPVQAAPAASQAAAPQSQLRTWPVQIQLAPINAPYFDGAKLLSQRTARPMPMRTTMRSSSRAMLCSSAVRSLILWTTAKSSRRSSRRMRSRA